MAQWPSSLRSVATPLSHRPLKIPHTTTHASPRVFASSPHRPRLTECEPHPYAQPYLRSLMDAALSEWLAAGGKEGQDALREEPRITAALALASNVAELALIPLALAAGDQGRDWTESVPALGLTTLARHEFYGAWLRAYALESPGVVTDVTGAASLSASLKKLLGVSRTSSAYRSQPKLVVLSTHLLSCCSAGAAEQGHARRDGRLRAGGAPLSRDCSARQRAAASCCHAQPSFHALHRSKRRERRGAKASSRGSGSLRARWASRPRVRRRS